MTAKKPQYYVETWDSEKQRFTPQKGLRTGPYSLWGLRKALRTLRTMGYDGGRHDASIGISRVDPD